MGLFSKKRYVCESCGKEFQKRINEKTEELKNLENQILGSEEKVINLEYNAFVEIRNEISKICKENNVEELNNTLLSEIVEKYLYKSKIVAILFLAYLLIVNAKLLIDTIEAKILKNMPQNTTNITDNNYEGIKNP